MVVDDHDQPLAILPASQLLRMMIPRYIQDDPTLARVLDEAEADRICDVLDDKTVAELLPRDRVPLNVVKADDTVMEIAAIMAANRSPVVAVVEGTGKEAKVLGAISVSQLLERLIGSQDEENEVSENL